MEIPNKPLSPQSAIIIYESTPHVYNANPSSAYLEKREIRLTENGEYRFGAGHPLTMESLAKTLEHIKIEKENEGFLSSGNSLIPKNLLYFNSSPDKRTLIWHSPSHMRNIFFSKNMGLPSGPVYIPHMLYVKQGNHLSAFALKAKNPTLKSRIYYPPLYNISHDGSVCMGSAFVKKGYSETGMIMQAWESAFWNSENSHFTHNAYQDQLNVNLFWKNMVKDPKPFPNNVLIKHTTFKNIQDIIRRFSR
jgi:PRTRC genetic system protein B